MKSKKLMFFASVILLIIVAIVIGVYNFYSSYMFNEDGTIDNPRQVFFEQVEKLSGDERVTVINFGVEHNIITQKEADKLLNEKE